MLTPGHSYGSMCIDIDRMLFTGDTVMQSRPYINKRNGSKEVFKQSIANVLARFNVDQNIYPGHGETFQLKDYKQ